MFLKFFIMLATLTSPFLEERSSSTILELESEVSHEFSKEFKAKTRARPVLILVAGLQGSGKSSLLTGLQEIYDANIISGDTIRHNLFSRGIKLTPQFVTSVNNIYLTLIKNSLDHQAHTFIDANAHAKRINEIANLLQKNHSHYSIVKIYLRTSAEILKARVLARQPTDGCYQGTLDELEAALISNKINSEDYDLIIDTDALTKDAIVNKVIILITPLML